MACKYKWHQSQALADFSTEENRSSRRKNTISYCVDGTLTSWVCAASHLNRQLGERALAETPP